MLITELKYVCLNFMYSNNSPYDWAMDQHKRNEPKTTGNLVWIMTNECKQQNI